MFVTAEGVLSGNNFHTDTKNAYYMPQQSTFQKSRLEEILAFLSKISSSNENTEYSADQEYLVEAIAGLARSKGRKDIVAEFETSYIHPMITIQKWVDELKFIADEALNDVTYGERHSLFKKKMIDMSGYDVRQFIGYLKEDGLIK
jgi:hypothetical protein